MDNLSPQQLSIVNATENNILVIACPGSGKTHTLIARYINLLNNGLKPEETIMITFTKKAGIEMLNRLNKYVPDKIPYHVGTIHGLSYKILKDYNKLNKTIIDELDMKELINNIIIKNNIQINDIYKIIDQISNINNDKDNKDIKLIQKLYKQHKNKENLIDFNDLMILLNEYLSKDISNVFKDKIKYVFFDEYQDVNNIQNNILLELSKNSNVMVVGDDAQSIYSFRGSSVKYILNYDLNKPFKLYLLEDNYRSSPEIINFCNDIISHNSKQYNKNIKPINNFNIKPNVLYFKNNKEEYLWIINDINKKIKDGVKLNDIAILSRKNNLLNNIELFFLDNNIPVSKHLGILLNKPHIKDFMAFLIIISNPKSSLHLNRMLKIFTQEDFNNKLLLIKKSNDKINMITHFLEEKFSKEYMNDIYKLLTYFNDNIEDFIQNLYLNQDVNEEINTIYLSTVHGSKGLEWRYVYIIDMNSYDFSFIHSKYYLDEIDNIEEERRLFYVAASRAKDGLIITYTNNMSSLLKEINPTLYNSYNIITKDKDYTFDFKDDINNHLKLVGYSKVQRILLDISNNIIIIKKMSNDINKNIIFSVIKGEFTHIYLKKELSKIINFKDCLINYKVSYNNISAIIDILYNDKIIIINSELSCRDLCEKLLYVYLLKKNNIIINEVIYYDTLTGIINNLNISNIDIINFKKIIY